MAILHPATLSIGLVGVGRWGRHILRDLRALDCEVTAVARSDASRERARDGGAGAIVASIEELGPVDGIVVVTPIHAHYETVRAALGHGVPVFVEKPLTDDPDKADDLVALAGDRLFVMDKWRYHPGVWALRDIARSGELGAVVGLRCARLDWGTGHLDDDDVWVLAPHDLAIALEVLGDVPAARHAAAYEIGGSSGLSGVLGEAPWVTVDVGGATPTRRRQVELLCRGGIAWLDDAHSMHVGVARAEHIGGEGWERRAITGELPLLAELRAFCGHLRGGPPPISSAQDAALVVRRIAELRHLAGCEDADFHGEPSL